jgi:hypothetical protein
LGLADFKIYEFRNSRKNKTLEHKGHEEHEGTQRNQQLRVVNERRLRFGAANKRDIFNGLRCLKIRICIGSRWLGHK